MKPVRAGVIGTGFAKRVQLPALKAVPEIELVALCSANLERARQVATEFAIPRATADYRELLGAPDIDLISIVTPSDLHLDITRAAFAAGKHVICEKPMGLNLAEARQMAAAARAAGTVHAIDHEMRYLPSRMRLKALLDEGYIGTPQFLRVAMNFNYGVVPTMKPYYYGRISLKAKSGGVVNQFGSHYIDLMRWWFGDFAEVAGLTKIIVPKRPVLPFELRDGDKLDASTPTLGEKAVETDDSFVLTGTMKNGALVSLAGGWSLHHGSGSSVEAYGDRGTLVLRNDESLWGGRKGEKELARLEVPATGFQHPAGGLVQAFAAMSQEIALAIDRQARGQAPGKRRYADFEDGMKVQEVVDALLNEAKPGWVRL